MIQGNAPRVSIVMPTYNRSVVISRALRSIITQTFSDWELIVIDDASTDDTPNVLARWAAQDVRIRVFRNESNQYPDISGILNKGLSLARGEYIARLDDDDWWHDPSKLQKQVAYLDLHPDCVVVGTGVIVTDMAGNERYRYLKRESDADIRNTALASNPFTHSTVMYRKIAAIEAGGYEERYAEDWILWLKMGKHGTLHNIPEHMTSYMMAGQNKSWEFQRDQAHSILELVRRFRYDYPRYHLAYLVNLLAAFYASLPDFIRNAWYPFASRFKRFL